MTANHFFADRPVEVEGVVTLEGDEAHHAARVLRVRVGEAITVADGSGRIVDAVVSSVGDVVEAEITGKRVVELPRPAVTLCQALTKGDKLDEVIEKATEVGVRAIVPFVAERTIVKWDERKLARAHERWSSIARAAAKQSRTAWIPVIEHVAVDASAATPDSGTRLVLHEGAERRLRDALPADPPVDVAIVVGPEGGLSDPEVDALAQKGADVVSLGPRVMRTETAGPVAIALIGYTYGWVG